MKKDIEENRKAHRKSSVTPPSRNNTIFMSVYPIPVFYVCVYVCVFVCVCAYTYTLVGCHLWGRRVGYDWSDLAAAAACTPF